MMKWQFFLHILLILNSGALSETSASTEAVEVTMAQRNISDELKDVMKHIPHEKITQIAEKHLKTDPGFIAVIKYMQGGAWKKLVENIRVNKAWIAFKDHMTHYGFDVDTIIHCSDTFIKNANITRDSDAPRSLNSFMEDVEESIPVADIISYLHQKMRKNVTLQELLDKISSKESNKIVQGALNIPEVQQMMKELNSMDLNLYEFLSFVYSFLGWGEFKVPK